MPAGFVMEEMVEGREKLTREVEEVEEEHISVCWSNCWFWLIGGV